MFNRKYNLAFLWDQVFVWDVCKYFSERHLLMLRDGNNADRRNEEGTMQKVTTNFNDVKVYKLRRAAGACFLCRRVRL